MSVFVFVFIILIIVIPLIIPITTAIKNRKKEENDTETVAYAVEDEIPEDVIVNFNSNHAESLQNISSDKIQILNQIESQKLLKSIDNNLKTIKTYIAIAFWISVSSVVILVLLAIIGAL